MENIIFRFVLEKKKEVACNACEESKMEEFSELFDGEKRLDRELNSEFFPFHSVENIFRFLFFLQLNELQLWRLKNLTKFCRGIIFLVSIVLRYKVGIFSSIPLSTENISLFSLLLEGNFSKCKKKKKKKNTSRIDESRKIGKRRNFVFLQTHPRTSSQDWNL